MCGVWCVEYMWCVVSLCFVPRAVQYYCCGDAEGRSLDSSSTPSPFPGVLALASLALAEDQIMGGAVCRMWCVAPFVFVPQRCRTAAALLQVNFIQVDSPHSFSCPPE